jgi:hypothetical protein
MESDAVDTLPLTLDHWSSYVAGLEWGPGHRDQSAYKAFLRASSLGVDSMVAIQVVGRLIRSVGGSFNATKLQSQLKRAYEFTGGSQATAVTIVQPATPKFDPDLLKGFAAKASGIDSQWLQSRSPLSPKEITSASFLEHLYHPGEKVLVFTSLHSQGEQLYEVGGDNAQLPKLTADGAWYLVNPVDGIAHPNPRQDNKPSRRSEESVTAWRYLVLESDVAEADQWLSCLVQLPLQISAIYTSGGKSIHALVRVDAESKQEWDAIRNQIRPILVPLGADEAAMTGVRLSRLPGALRGLQQQELLYLNPQPSPEPIFKL